MQPKGEILGSDGLESEWHLEHPGGDVSSLAKMWAWSSGLEEGMDGSGV